jgi:hypothetical protein
MLFNKSELTPCYARAAAGVASDVVCTVSADGRSFACTPFLVNIEGWRT